MRVALVFSAILALVYSEVAEWTSCSADLDATCTISGIEVDPCKAHSYCKFKKGKKATLDIDYIPKFSGDKVKTGLYWASANGDVPFSEFSDANACEHTSCPLQASTSNHFHHSIHIGKKLPTGDFPLKWKLWNEDDPSQQCCFKLNVKLSR